ncbi:RNA-directed DNA polymerase, eukaryota, reverse transcriptase zinc-binding domain protein [Tanacetum coccineum]
MEKANIHKINIHKINIHKSNIYGIEVNKDEVLSMTSNAGCIAGDIPFNYLGLPIGFNMKSIASWKTLVDLLLLLTFALLQKWRWRLLSSPTPFGVQSFIPKLIMVKKEVSDTNGCSFNGNWANIVGSSNFLHSKGQCRLCGGGLSTWNRLPHRLNLSSRGMDIPAISCPSCNANVESANHVFFECDIATDMWKLVFRWCDIPLFQASSWDSFNDWIISWHASKEKKHRFYVITTSVLWWLWRYRNSVTFNSQPLRKSDLLIMLVYLHFRWLHKLGTI